MHDRHDYPEGITRLVVLGDPHGDLAALEQVVAREAGPQTAFLSVGDNVGYASGPDSSAFCQRLIELGARSVRGNHEEWISAEGELAIVLPPRHSERRLRPEALAWARALPLALWLRFAAAPRLRVLARHTIGPGWGYVHAGNAAALAYEERAEVVLVGHSHGPSLYAIGEGDPFAGEVMRLPLASSGDEQIELPLPGPFERLVVDAGSLGRPGHHPEPPALGMASYALLDLVAGTASLRAFVK
ncbi:MAG: metallophosphoesterase [Planctomycetota bacterium]